MGQAELREPTQALHEVPLVIRWGELGMTEPPPTHLVLAGYDPLHDEGAACADALQAASVRVTVHEHLSLCHGFYRFTAVCAAARAAVTAITGAARELFDGGPQRARKPPSTP